MIFSKTNTISYGQDFQFKTGIPSGIDFKIEKLDADRVKLTANGYGELNGNYGYGNGSLYISLKDYQDESDFQNRQNFKVDGYLLWTTDNHQGDEVIMLSFPSDENMSISKKKLVEFFEKCYEEDF